MMRRMVRTICGMLAIGLPWSLASDAHAAEAETPLSALRSLQWDWDEVCSVHFSPDGSRLAVGDGSWDSGRATVLQVATGRPLIDLLPRRRGPVYDAAFSPDGRFVALNDWNSITLLDADTGRLLHSFQGSGTGETCSSVAFSPDGRMLASGGRAPDHTTHVVNLWEVGSGRLIRSLHGHTHAIQAVAFTADGRMLASGSEDGSVKLWSLPDGHPTGSLESGAGDVHAVAFSPDGRTLASIDAESLDSHLRLWEVSSGRLRFSIQKPAGQTPRSIAFSPDGSILASVGDSLRTEDHGIALWDAKTGELVRSWDPVFNVRAVAFSQDGRTLASGGGVGVDIWETATGRPVHSFRARMHRITAFALAPDDRTLVSTNHTWDLQSGRPQFRDAYADSLAFSPDGRILASGSYSGLELRDANSGQPFDRLERHALNWGGGGESLTFSQDGRLFAAGGHSYAGAAVWDVDTGRLLFDYRGENDDSINAVALSPDGHLLATGGHKEQIKVKDVHSGKLLHALGRRAESGLSIERMAFDWIWPPESAYALAFSPDGRLLASGGQQLVKLWDAQEGDLRRVFAHHSKAIRSVAFSRDGRLLASGSDDNSARIWDVAGGGRLNSLKHESAVRAVAFSADGRTLVSGGITDGLRFWDVSSGALLARIEALPQDEWVVIGQHGYVASPGAHTFLALRQRGRQSPVGEAFRSRWLKESLSEALGFASLPR